MKQEQKKHSLIKHISCEVSFQNGCKNKNLLLFIFSINLLFPSHVFIFLGFLQVFSFRYTYLTSPIWIRECMLNVGLRFCIHLQIEQEANRAERQESPNGPVAGKEIMRIYGRTFSFSLASCVVVCDNLLCIFFAVPCLPPLSTAYLGIQAYSKLFSWIVKYQKVAEYNTKATKLVLIGR